MMKWSLVGVLLLAAVVKSATPVDDDELANKILKRASRSVETTSFLNTLDDFLFLFEQGTSSVGSELLNNVLFTLDFVTPSFDYVMNSVYGRGYRLNEKYKKYVQMYMTEDQIADHNHLMKIFKEQFNEDYDRYLQSGIDTGNLYGTTQPISQNALDYLGRTITGYFPPGQQYTQQQLATGVASVLQGFENVQNPPNVYYFPQKVPVPAPAPSQPRAPEAPVPQKLPPNSGWQQDPNGDWFYITYLKNEDLPSDGSPKVKPLSQPPGPPPYGTYAYIPSSSDLRSRNMPHSGPYPRAQPKAQRQTYSQGRVETRVPYEYPYKEYVVSSPRFPPASSGENVPKQSQRPGGARGTNKGNDFLQSTSQNEQSSYTSYEISDADPSHSDLTKMYPPAISSPNFQRNGTKNIGGATNTEGIPEAFLDISGQTSSQSYSVPKSRKRRLAELYQSDLPPKILFCPPENLKLILCAGDIAIDVFLVKPVLYVLSWFI